MTLQVPELQLKCKLPVSASGTGVAGLRWSGQEPTGLHGSRFSAGTFWPAA